MRESINKLSSELYALFTKYYDMFYNMRFSEQKLRTVRIFVEQKTKAKNKCKF